jgi:hypothetical protein
MRPENFPSVRLAQLAALINQSSHLFSKALESFAASDIRALLDVTANDYWHYHYMLDEPSSFKPKKLGHQMANNIIANTIVPIVYSYGHVYGNPAYKEKALKWLLDIEREENSITRNFSRLGIVCKNAFDTQFVLELKESYCDKRRCLDCAVGNSILNRSKFS